MTTLNTNLMRQKTNMKMNNYPLHPYTITPNLWVDLYKAQENKINLLPIIYWYGIVPYVKIVEELKDVFSHDVEDYYGVFIGYVPEAILQAHITNIQKTHTGEINVNGYIL